MQNIETPEPVEEILTPEDHAKLDKEEATVFKNIERAELAALELSL